MKNLISIILILIACCCKAQQPSSVAVSYGLGNGKIASFLKSGGTRIEGKSLHVFGLNYWHGIGRNLFFETGIQFFRYSHSIEHMGPNSYPENRVMNMVSVPFKVRFEVGKYIFFNGGITADLSKAEFSVRGIGVGIGTGVQFNIAKELKIYLSPQANLHATTSKNSYFAESNIAFGISYSIPN